MANELKYKGIMFDDFVQDEYGVWSQICKKCQAKYADRLTSNEIQGEGGGVCGVCGCNESDWQTGTEVNYIDFDDDEIELISKEWE